MKLCGCCGFDVYVMFNEFESLFIDDFFYINFW